MTPLPLQHLSILSNLLNLLIIYHTTYNNLFLQIVALVPRKSGMVRRVLRNIAPIPTPLASWNPFREHLVDF